LHVAIVLGLVSIVAIARSPVKLSGALSVIGILLNGDFLLLCLPFEQIRGGAGVGRVFITGSSDGLGLMAARLLIEQGHEVVLHGRNEGRSRDALAAAAGARGAVTGDLSTIAGARTVADQVNKLGRFDAIIHNAGIGYREGRVETEPGVPSIFAVNVLAPYILTALIEKPDRLVYLSSGMHHGVRLRMDDLLWTKRSWSGFSAYAESKLCDVLLAFAVARRWKDVKSNALEPGWVATKMGGPSAPDDLHQGCVTQAWLATSEDELARSTGGYFYHQRPRVPNPIAADLSIQEELLAECGRTCGIPLD
jgi:NAD(P)-dependent dehydrogenase (short-subunit alcohol dehydrogenase family)